MVSQAAADQLARPDSNQADIERGVNEATRAYIEQAVRKAVDAQNLGANIDKAVREARSDEIAKAVAEADAREGGGPGFVFPHGAYTDIKNILAIQNDPVYEVALREWDRREAYLGNRVDRREKASADLVNQLFNIVGFFSVFQGVVLTAVSQLKSDTSCGIIWFPVILSTVACVVSIVGLRIKFRNLKELEDSIRDEKSAQKVSPCNLSISAYNLSSDQLVRLNFVRLAAFTSVPRCNQNAF